MKVRRLFAATGMVCLAAVALAGCKKEEQGRITRYEPGVYKGKPDQSLSAEQQRALRLRATMQSGISAPAGGGGRATPRDVRKPQSPAIDHGKLNNRTRNQKGS